MITGERQGSGGSDHGLHGVGKTERDNDSSELATCTLVKVVVFPTVTRFIEGAMLVIYLSQQRLTRLGTIPLSTSLILLVRHVKSDFFPEPVRLVVPLHEFCCLILI